MAWLLDQPTATGNYCVVGFIDDDYDKQGMRIYGVNILGTCEDIPQLVEKHDVGLIIYTGHQNCTNGHKSLLDVCASTSARFVFVPDIHTSLNGAAVISSINQKGSKLREDEGGVGELNCYHCLIRYAEMQMEAELDELESKMEGGNLDDVQSDFQATR
jgi:hypothetical protein